MEGKLQDREYYSARAQHAREMADKAEDESVRNTHLRMAASYEAMAVAREKIAQPFAV
jgi:hypothetical protein